MLHSNGSISTWGKVDSPNIEYLSVRKDKAALSPARFTATKRAN